MPDTDSITFRKLQIADIPHMVAWLNTDHVKQWWRERIDDTDEPLTYKDVMREYLPRITGRKPDQCYLILDQRLPIGYIQTYLIQSWPDYAELVAVDEIAAGVDMFIGELGHIGKGLAAPILRQFLRDHVFTRLDVASCITGPAVSNERAIYVYQNAGFRYLKTITAPDAREPEYLMRIGRSEVMFGSMENRESWQQLLDWLTNEMFEHRPAYFDELAVLVRHIIDSPRASLFRGGTQMSELIISTKGRHGLEIGDSSIKISPVGELTDFEVEYHDGITNREDQQICDAGHLLTTLDPLLERLWAATKPTRIKLTDL